MEEALCEVQKIRGNLFGILEQIQGLSLQPEEMHEADRRAFERQLLDCTEGMRLIQAELDTIHNRLCVFA